MGKGKKHLTDDDVREIVDRNSRGETINDLASEYGCHKGTIFLRRRKLNLVGPGSGRRRGIRGPARNPKITEEDVRKMMERHKMGERVLDICKDVGIHKSSYYFYRSQLSGKSSKPYKRNYNVTLSKAKPRTSLALRAANQSTPLSYIDVPLQPKDQVREVIGSGSNKIAIILVNTESFKTIMGNLWK